MWIKLLLAALLASRVSAGWLWDTEVPETSGKMSRSSGSLIVAYAM
jgi:hypothetical protein